MSVKKPKRMIGAEKEDFEVEAAIEVVIRKSLKDRVHDAVWVAVVAATATTFAQVVLIPLFN